jgi:hypothetical protein
VTRPIVACCRHGYTLVLVDQFGGLGDAWPEIEDEETGLVEWKVTTPDGESTIQLQAGFFDLLGEPVTIDGIPVVGLDDVGGHKTAAQVPLTELTSTGCPILGQRRWLVARFRGHGLGDGERDLAALIVSRVGGLRETGDPWEPYRLHDAAGAVVVPVSAFLKKLQASARPATTQRSYAMDLLRWFRFCWAVGVSWEQATRAEARDFSRWIQVSDKTAGRQPARRPGMVNPLTGKSSPWRAYAPATVLHSETVL